MKPVSVLLLVTVAIVVGVITALLTVILARHGFSSFYPSSLIGLAYLLISVILLWAGLAVRKWRRHEPTWVDALTAMRIAMCARAAAWVGSVSVGVSAGILFPILSGASSNESFVQSAVISGLSLLVGSLLLAVIAVIVERWCVIDISDDSTNDEHHTDPDAMPV